MKCREDRFPREVESHTADSPHYSCKIHPWETSFGLRFEGIIRRINERTGKRVVILVDEYDKPMLQSIGDDALQEEFRSTLKEFYSVLKTQDRYIRFAFLTGVTKFGKVSVFSDLNNLNDISMDARFVDICGNPELFLTRLQTLYTSGDYSIQGDKELYFQNTMWAVFKVMGFYVDVERKTSKGRIDIVVKTDNYIYVLELKLDGTPEKALQQINDKGYAEQYRMDGRKVWKIGINFSSADGSIGGWRIEDDRAGND